MNAPFKDRRDAGRALARRLGQYLGLPDVIVLGLPRGGVPVAFEVAAALKAPLDVFTVRKLGVPGQEELAMGAVASGDVVIRNEEVIDTLSIRDETIQRAVERERKELARRQSAYREDRPFPEIEGHVVILVDDGLATGSSMQAAVAAVRKQNPERIVVAVPIASPETCDSFRELVDEVICLVTPQYFQAVGSGYEDFGQTSDDEVRELLRKDSKDSKDNKDDKD